MDVMIDNDRIRLNQTDVIGSGGEGTVFRSQVKGQETAIKIYHQLDRKRGEKLKTFLANNWSLPTDKIATPRALVFDAHGQHVVGLSMPFLGTGFEELTSLANKKYRAAYLINTKGVADIFLDGGTTLASIHQNGLVIGDFNDLNALFRGSQMLFIDVDAWQFGTFPCPVATEQFLAPELYGIDLSQRPVFKPEHDWYSFAVILFKSLLWVHPYGGTHNGYKQLTARAKNRITVLDPQVTYPRIALSPDLLNDDLAEQFDRIFRRGERKAFPLEILREYAEDLGECPKCHTYYPQSRQLCPVCSEKTLIIIQQPTTVSKGVEVIEFIRTSGNIVYHKLVGNTLTLIAYENGQAVLYRKTGSGLVNRLELFAEIPGAKYELLDNVLVVNFPGQTELLLVDVSGNKVKPLLKSETTMFSGSRKAMFRTSGRYLFRIVNGNLMYGELGPTGMLVERRLRGAMNQHTWFTIHTEAYDKPSACGFFQVMNQQMFWLVWEGATYDNLPLSSLESGEVLLDVLVRFSSQGVLIRRQTQFSGVNYLRTEMVNENGIVVHSSARIRQEDHPTGKLHGQAYSTGKLLHASDEGIVSEEIATGVTKKFDATDGYVDGGDILIAYKGGLLVVKDDLVLQLTLT